MADPEKPIEFSIRPFIWHQLNNAAKKFGVDPEPEMIEWLIENGCDGLNGMVRRRGDIWSNLHPEGADEAMVTVRVQQSGKSQRMAYRDHGQAPKVDVFHFEAEITSHNKHWEFSSLGGEVSARAGSFDGRSLGPLNGLSVFIGVREDHTWLLFEHLSSAQMFGLLESSKPFDLKRPVAEVLDLPIEGTPGFSEPKTRAELIPLGPDA